MQVIYTLWLPMYYTLFLFDIVLFRRLKANSAVIPPQIGAERANFLLWRDYYVSHISSFIVTVCSTSIFLFYSPIYFYFSEVHTHTLYSRVHFTITFFLLQNSHFRNVRFCAIYVLYIKSTNSLISNWYIHWFQKRKKKKPKRHSNFIPVN